MRMEQVHPDFMHALKEKVSKLEAEKAKLVELLKLARLMMKLFDSDSEPNEEQSIMIANKLQEVLKSCEDIK